MKTYIKDSDVEEHKRSIAIKIIECLDELYDLRDTISISTTHHNNPKQYSIIVQDKTGDKIGINIHKLK